MYVVVPLGYDFGSLYPPEYADMIAGLVEYLQIGTTVVEVIPHISWSYCTPPTPPVLQRRRLLQENTTQMMNFTISIFPNITTLLSPLANLIVDVSDPANVTLTLARYLSTRISTGTLNFSQSAAAGLVVPRQTPQVDLLNEVFAPPGEVGPLHGSLCIIMYGLPGNVDYPWSLCHVGANRVRSNFCQFFAGHCCRCHQRHRYPHVHQSLRCLIRYSTHTGVDDDESAVSRQYLPCR